jgi:hypothetical protein
MVHCELDRVGDTALLRLLLLSLVPAVSVEKSKSKDASSSPKYTRGA